MMLGHSHPDVVAAVQREVERGLGLGGPTELEAEIAEEITSRFPSIDKVRFCNSGTEASLHATRLVRAKTGRPKVAKFEGGYHGSHDALEVSSALPAGQGGARRFPERRRGVGGHVEERRGGRGHPAVQRPGVGSS